jgi:hypothetical protein
MIQQLGQSLDVINVSVAGCVNSRNSSGSQYEVIWPKECFAAYHPLQIFEGCHQNNITNGYRYTTFSSFFLGLVIEQKLVIKGDSTIVI